MVQNSFKNITIIEARLKRILIALHSDIIPHSFEDPLIYLKGREKWVQLKYIYDYDKTCDNFSYIVKYTPQGEISTWLISFNGNEIKFGF